ncbi:MAG: response regulator [Bacteroidetes bacterium]|nr:response regulator [Bacteroidota bacterium]
MKKILLIEDNEGIRESTAELLELADYVVITAADGKTGVELAKTSKPDIILCDIMMPKLDGYGVLSILSKNPETYSIPFIFMSAKSDKMDIRKGMNLGADDYLTKPFEESELMDAIESRLNRSEKIKTNMLDGLDSLNEFYNEARGHQELKNLSEDRKIKTYEAKEEIYRQDDYANYLYFIVKGTVKCSRTDSYGKTIVTDIYGPSDFIGYTTLLDDGEFHDTAIALEQTQVAVIPKSDFLDLIRKNRNVALKFIKLMAGDIHERGKKILQLAYASVQERVASSLLMLYEREKVNGQNGDIRISRDDLASVVGTAKESLIRMLSEFKKEGLIESEGLTLKIINEPRLRQIACD